MFGYVPALLGQARLGTAVGVCRVMAGRGLVWLGVAVKVCHVMSWSCWVFVRFGWFRQLGYGSVQFVRFGCGLVRFGSAVGVRLGVV